MSKKIASAAKGRTGKPSKVTRKPTPADGPADRDDVLHREFVVPEVKRDKKQDRLRLACVLHAHTPSARHAFVEFRRVAETADRLAAMLSGNTPFAAYVQADSHDVNLLKSLATIARLAVLRIEDQIPRNFSVENPEDLMAEWQNSCVGRFS